VGVGVVERKNEDREAAATQKKRQHKDNSLQTLFVVYQRRNNLPS
jgi:hypothetical protein